jgi:drug/metabolite transporter (DMT)-like permease
MKKNNLYGIIIALIAVLIISPDTLFMIWGDMPAFQMVAWRGILAGLCYLVIWIISTRSLIKKDFANLFSNWGITIFLCYFINTILFCIGISIAPAPVVLFCIATAPIFAAIFGQLILLEPANKTTWITIFLVMIGISIAIWGSNTQEINFDVFIILGALCGLGSAITIALSFVKVREKKDLPFVLPMGLGVFISGVVGLFVTQYENMMSGNVLPIAITGIFVLPIPMYLLSYASRYTRATNVSLILLLESVLGPLWIWLGTGDQPTDLTLFGGFIVIFSTGSYLLISKQN